MAAETAVRREIVIAARPETVWEFLVDEDKATLWMGIDAALDPQPGGEYRVEVLPGEIASGRFLELDPPRRLVHSWGWASGGRAGMPPGSTRVEIELTSVEGGTLVSLTHSNLPSLEAAANHGRGWEHYLSRLAAAATGDKTPDPWVNGGVPWRR